MADGEMGDDELERRVEAAAAAVREREILGQRCEELGQRMYSMHGEVIGLRELHAVELEDVERLEGLSLTRVLASLRGGREDELARERAEADALALRVRSAEERLAAVRREHDGLWERWEALAGAPAAYVAVLDEKEAVLARSGDGRAPRILARATDRRRPLPPRRPGRRASRHPHPEPDMTR